MRTLYITIQHYVNGSTMSVTCVCLATTCCSHDFRRAYGVGLRICVRDRIWIYFFIILGNNECIYSKNKKNYIFSYNTRLFYSIDLQNANIVIEMRFLSPNFKFNIFQVFTYMRTIRLISASVKEILHYWYAHRIND